MHASTDAKLTPWPMVLLLHESLNGSSHFDWLLARDDSGLLLSHRVLVRIDEGAATAFDAERIAEHRRRYLSYEGPISRGRGRVSRVAKGVCVVRREAEDSLELMIDWGAGWRRVRGRRLDGEGSRWRFSLEAGEDAEPA